MQVSFDSPLAVIVYVKLTTHMLLHTMYQLRGIRSWRGGLCCQRCERSQPSRRKLVRTAHTHTHGPTNTVPQLSTVVKATAVVGTNKLYTFCWYKFARRFDGHIVSEIIFGNKWKNHETANPRPLQMSESLWCWIWTFSIINKNQQEATISSTKCRTPKDRKLNSRLNTDNNKISYHGLLYYRWRWTCLIWASRCFHPLGGRCVAHTHTQITRSPAHTHTKSHNTWGKQCRRMGFVPLSLAHTHT